jgi:transposase
MSKESRKAEMLRMRDEGKTLAEIGKRYSITHQAVSLALGGKARKRAMEAKYATVVDAHSKGLSCREISEACGMSMGSISKYTTIARGAGDVARPIDNAAAKAEVLSLAKSGMRPKEIADKLGLDPGAVTGWIARFRRNGEKLPEYGRGAKKIGFKPEHAAIINFMRLMPRASVARILGVSNYEMDYAVKQARHFGIKYEPYVAPGIGECQGATAVSNASLSMAA